MSGVGGPAFDPESFAHEWIAGWNARDLDRILDHYADDVIFSSPKAQAITGSARVVGKPGGKEELVLQAPAERPKIPPPVDTRTTPSPQPTPDAPKESSKPLPPVVFFVAGGLTLVAGGATVWSGIDTINNPGQDAVRRDCVGQDESCPTYQKGRDAQLRTNVLIGATAGLGVVTAVIGVFFTRWGGDATAKKTGAAPTVLPFVQVGGDARHAPAPSGGGLQGTF